MPKELKIVTYAAIGILVIIGVIYLFAASPSSQSNGNDKDNKNVSSSNLSALNNISLTSIKKASTSSQNPLVPISDQPISTKNNLPLVTYIGADYCPYCAAERWPLVIALSKFGNFSDLKYMTSSATDVYPSTSTFTFYGAKYSSKYISFDSVEQYTNQPSSNGGYTSLQKATSDQQALLTKYDSPPYVPSQSQGSIPFIDLGNKYILSGTQFTPQDIQGKNWDSIISDIQNDKSPAGRDILSSTNILVKAICSLTNNQPTNVCQ